MKKQTLSRNSILALAGMVLFASPAAAQNLAQDTLTVRIVLDVNGLRSTPVFEVAEIDPKIARVVALRLDKRGLVDLPPEISALDALKYLALADNHLDSLPDALWGLRNLVSLDLGGNLLASLDARVGRLRSLLFLGLRGNGLTALPDSLFTLPHLENLLVSGNALAALPESVGEMAFLKYLDLSVNALHALPFTIAALGLDSLDVSSNALDSLPATITLMNAGTRVRLANNRLCNLNPALSAWADSKDPAWRATQSCGAPIRPAARAPRGPALRARSGTGYLRLDWSGLERLPGARAIVLRDAAGREVLRRGLADDAAEALLPIAAEGFLWAELRVGGRSAARAAISP